MASHRNEKATSGRKVGPSTSRSGEDREVFTKNQITFDEFNEAVTLGRIGDSENPHLPHPNLRPNDTRNVGEMPMWPALIAAGLRQPLHVDVVDLCRQLTISPLQLPLNS
ncbi:hypothetical protein CDL15_Pgr016531 [Punica granatum]|uniref:Uncharacterized protein n=1 Tax=Punica granatum TaxID=22663 RepID=A0A218WKA2_PUNGR|nr:hypothetical protein CDL15_Pgr016531 [Punica granatum]